MKPGKPLQRKAWMKRGTSELKRTPLARSSSSLTLSELRAERGEKSPLRRTSNGLRRTKLRQRNPERIARKLKKYRARLARADWQQLRRRAYERDQGLCQCPPCLEGRKHGEAWAWEPIDIWFDKKGKIHGFSTHHTTYSRFCEEDLNDLLTMRIPHHNAVEALYGYRQKWLGSRCPTP